MMDRWELERVLRDMGPGAVNDVLTYIAAGQIGWAAAVGGFTEMVHVYHTANQAINNITTTPLTFNSEFFDTDNMHDGVNPTRITFTTAGTYVVGGNIAWAANNNNTRWCGMRFGGAVNYRSGIWVQATQGQNTEMICPLTVRAFNAAEYVEFAVWQNSGGALNVITVYNTLPFAWAFRVA